MTRFRWTPLLVWIGVILTSTSIPNLSAPGPAGMDKAGHLFLYGVLGILTIRALWDFGQPSRTVVMSLAAIAVFAAVDEWHQGFVPGRSADVADWIADVTGAVLGVGLNTALRLRRVAQT